MYISEQRLNPDARCLRLSAQLGVRHVVLDDRGTELVSAQGGVSAGDAGRLGCDRVPGRGSGAGGRQGWRAPGLPSA